MKLVEAELLLTQAQGQTRAMPGTGAMLEALSTSQPSTRPLGGWPITPGAAQQLLGSRTKGQQPQQETGKAAGIDLDKLTEDDWSRLKELASPRLLTVWFNSWWVHGVCLLGPLFQIVR